MALGEIHFHLSELKLRLGDVGQRFLGPELCGEAKRFANNHPFLVATLLVTLLFSAVPIIFFVCFAVITSVISLVCFICIEGCLLIVGGLILTGIVSLIAVVSAGVTAFFCTTLWFAQIIHHTFCSHISAQLPDPPSTEG